TNPYRYDAQRLDAATGLYQLRARFYDPSIGRFLTRDTAEVSGGAVRELNRYAYAHDAPVDLTDPSGHVPAGAGSVALPRSSAGGTLGEYVALLINALAVAAALALVGEETNCLVRYTISFFMALTRDYLGLYTMAKEEPGEPARCRIPILLYPYAPTPMIAQHILDAQNGLGSNAPTENPMLLSYHYLTDSQQSTVRRLSGQNFVAT